MSATNQHLALVFLPDSLAVALWQMVDGKVTVLNQSIFVPLESTTLPTINAALDTVLDQLGEAGLGVKDCLFCVPNSWAQGEGLRSEKKTILKNISDDLVLKPLGFVVNSDALAASDKLRTGNAFSGLVLFPTDLTLAADLYRDGNLVQSEEVGRSELETDIHELLARFDSPKRILLVESALPTDSKKVEEALRKLSGTTIETLSRSEMAQSVISVGGAETLAVVPEEKVEEEKEPEPIKTDEAGDFVPPAFLIHRTEETAVPDEEPTTAEPAPTPKKKPFTFPVINLSRYLRTLKPMGKKRSMFVMAGVAVLVFGLLSWFFMRQAYSASIDIQVKSQEFEVEETFLLTTDEADIAGATRSALRASPVTESVTVDKEVPTTGSKVIGDPAKGKVTIYNRTSQEKTFPAGTKLASGKLQFTLDKEVKVASSSSQSDYTVVPGTADVDITASAIGPESNLPKDTEFTIANFDKSSYVAKNKDALTGGTSREIQAVAQKDIDGAKKDLILAAQEQLREKFSSLSTDEEPVFFTGVVKTTEEEVDAKVGDEKKFVSVKLTIEGTGARLRQEDAIEAARKLFPLPEGFSLQEETVDLEPLEVKVQGGGFVVRAKLRARGVPNVSAAQIVDSVKGEYAPRAQTKLEENSNFSSVSVQLRPFWADILFNTIPSDPDRISVSIRLEGAP